MRSLRFKKLDAFSVGGSSGNPAGAVYLEKPNDLSPTEMQALAKQLHGVVSEVGFLSRIEQDHFWIRYYSSVREVDFCGHATIAIMYDLICNDPELSIKNQVSISTKNSKLIVENRIPTENCVFITSPSPRFRPFQDPIENLCAALRTSRNAIAPDFPVSIVNAGLETLIVPVIDLASILSISPDTQELKSYCLSNAIDIITVFTNETAFKSSQFRTRVFAPTFGYLEDPATGSGNAALGHYLIANDKWDGGPVSIEQNGSRDKPNVVKLVAHHDGNQHKVLFGGSALVRIDGIYHMD